MPSLQLSLKICSIISLVNCGLAAVGWIIYVVSLGATFAYRSGAFIGSLKYGPFWVVGVLTPFALLVYARFTLIMCHYLLDSKKFMIRLVIVIVFFLLHFLFSLVALVELGVFAPWNLLHGDPTYSSSCWAGMLVGVVWMMLFSIMTIVFASLTSYFSLHPRRHYEQLTLQWNS